MPCELLRLSISAGQRSVRFAARAWVSGRCPCPEFASESISVNVHVSLCVLESVSLSMNVCISYGWVFMQMLIIVSFLLGTKSFGS